MAPDSLNSSRKTQLWIFALVILAVLSFLAMRRSMVRGMNMSVATTASASTGETNVGAITKLVMEVKAVDPNATASGNALEKQTEAVYRRTGATVTVNFDAATPIVMGKTSDVHAGAVVHITAKMGADRLLHAEQIVILTGYVEVK